LQQTDLADAVTELIDLVERIFPVPRADLDFINRTYLTTSPRGSFSVVEFGFTAGAVSADSIGLI
jgi:hypothetical protein